MVTRVRVGKGKRRRARTVLVAKGRYNLATGQRKVTRLALTKAGRRLLIRAGRRGLRVRAGGPGVKNRAVRIQTKANRRGAAKRRRARR